jgi:hypothetical protein
MTGTHLSLVLERVVTVAVAEKQRIRFGMKSECALDPPRLVFGQTMRIQPKRSKRRVQGVAADEVYGFGRRREAIVGVYEREGYVVEGAQRAQKLREVAPPHNLAAHFGPKQLGTAVRECNLQRTELGAGSRFWPLRRVKRMPLSVGGA